MLSILFSSEEYLALQMKDVSSEPSPCPVSQLRQLYDIRLDDAESSDPTNIDDVERPEYVDGEDVGFDADNIVDRSTMIGDEAVAAVDETTVLDVLGANGSANRRIPSSSTQY
jgi:hypothetical protein